MNKLKRLFVVLTLFLCVNPLLQTRHFLAEEEVKIDDCMGHFVLDDRPSIIDDIIIETDKFEEILNNDQPPSDENPDEIRAWIDDLIGSSSESRFFL